MHYREQDQLHFPYAVVILQQSGGQEIW